MGPQSTAGPEVSFEYLYSLMDSCLWLLFSMKILSIYFPWTLYLRQVYRRQCLSSGVGVSWYLWLHHKEIRSRALDFLFSLLSFPFWTKFALFCDPVQTTELCCCENKRLKFLVRNLFEDVFSPIWLFFREPTKEFKANSHFYLKMPLKH